MNKTDKTLHSWILVGNTDNKEINYDNCFDEKKKECCDKQAIFELNSENKKKILKSKGRAFQKIASTETLKWGENWSI